MTFEQLDFFITTVQSETFFDAAEKLHTTQSTLSKQMKKLEKELDLTLWDRSRRLLRCSLRQGSILQRSVKALPPIPCHAPYHAGVSSAKQQDHLPRDTADPLPVWSDSSPKPVCKAAS